MAIAISYLIQSELVVYCHTSGLFIGIEISRQLQDEEMVVVYRN